MVLLLFKLALIAAAHVAVGLILYYQRTIQGHPVFDSDTLVFVLPMALAFAGYFWVTWSYAFPSRQGIAHAAVAASVAVVATIVSTTAIFWFAFNKWGS